MMLPLRRAVPALLALALALAPLAAAAQETVQVTVHVIHASKKEGKVDPRLKELVKQLKDFPFKSYALHRVQELDLTLNTSGEVELPDDRKLIVTPLPSDEPGRLKLRALIPEKVVDTTIRIENGKTFIIGGPRHDDGTLVLAVTATAG